jgi:peroxiredoxin Q/BCP
MAELTVGKKAPAFTLTDQHGKKVKLSDYAGKKVVVYFYPKADTTGCTQQSCNLRDRDAAVETPQGRGRHRHQPRRAGEAAQVRREVRPRIPAPRREDHTVAEKYGVWAEKSMYGRTYMGIVRSAFVIDEAGKLSGVYYKVSPKDTLGHVIEGLKA